MTEAYQDFNQIPLKNMMLDEIYIDPLRRARLVFGAWFLPNGETPKGTIFEIQFNKILNFNIDMKAMESSVISHSVIKESELVLSLNSNLIEPDRKIDNEKIAHFQFVFNAGNIDFLAESFSCNLIWEL